MNGILFIDKETDWTSFDVCNRARRIFNEKKVGHCGTLDPFATGLMIVALGQGTKVIPFLENENKTYTASIKLGEATDSGDLTGNVIKTMDIPDLNIKQINDVLNSFLGKSKQVPPMYSAVKYNGLPLYMYARDGIEIERKSRDIEIFNINLISFENNIITYSTTVSKGTFIRTLSEEIASKLNTVGHLIALRRNNIGKYDLSLAKKINEIRETDILSIDSVLTHIKTIIADHKLEQEILHGKPIILKTDADLVYLKSESGTPLAIYYKKGNLYYSKRGLFNENDLHK